MSGVIGFAGLASLLFNHIRITGYDSKGLPEIVSKKGEAGNFLSGDQLEYVIGTLSEGDRPLGFYFQKEASGKGFRAYLRLHMRKNGGDNVSRVFYDGMEPREGFQNAVLRRGPDFKF